MLNAVQQVFLCLLTVAFNEVSQHIPSTYSDFRTVKVRSERRKQHVLLIDFLLFSRVHATLQPALSVGRSVGPLVRHTLLFYDFITLTSRLLPKWSGDLKYGPCPPARDFGSRVSSLV